MFEWAKLNERQYPELALLHAIPNGGHRIKAVAVQMRKEGVRPGVPDVCLPVARQGFHGLYIEMKYGRNIASDNQIAWMDALETQGFRVALCYSCEEATVVILDYLGASAPAGKF